MDSKVSCRNLFKRKKCLGEYILKTTLYHDFDDDYLSEDKPDGVYRKDYAVFRFGTLYECYEIDQEIRIEYDISEEYNYIMIPKNRMKSILLQDLEGINFHFASYVRKAK